MYDTQGNSQGYRTSVHDITALKRIENALRESEEKYRIVFATERDALFMIDQETQQIIDVNNWACSLYGYSKSELVRMKNIDVSAEPEKTSEATKLTSDRIPLRYHRKKDGTIFPVDISSSFFQFKGRKVILSAIRDITERIEQEHKLEYKNEQLHNLIAQKDKFFSIIAHDLRSPIVGFLGLTERMAENIHEMEIDEIQELAVLMRDNASNLFNLLSNLLKWAAMQQGKLTNKPALVKLLSQILDSSYLSIAAASTKEIEIAFDIDDDVYVYADPDLLDGISRNLISNAVKFTPRGGKIHVTAAATGNDLVKISVSDTGIGMDNAMIGKLFSYEGQVNRRGTEGELSTGLGLIICKEFTEKLGGSIQVESKTGQGSTFSFTVPARKPDENNVHYYKINQETEARKLNILIAEDDEISENLISIAVKKIANQVYRVKNGLHAVETFRSHPDIDLIFMDIRMPLLDGYNATRQIRKISDKVIIIAQTAYALSGNRESALKAGCNFYIKKPVGIGELQLAIMQFFPVKEFF